MDNNGYKKMYKKIYSLLGDTTPLKADCGLLCSQRCCSGSQNIGMLLFPGEETSLEVRENNGRRLALCSGKCDRAGRPLSCMIFPFFPAVDERGKISVVPDYRGVALCPLITNSEVIAFNGRFFKKLLKAGKLLAKDSGCREFMKEITGEINEAKELYSRLEG